MDKKYTKQERTLNYFCNLCNVKKSDPNVKIVLLKNLKKIAPKEHKSCYDIIIDDMLKDEEKRSNRLTGKDFERIMKDVDNEIKSLNL